MNKIIFSFFLLVFCNSVFAENKNKAHNFSAGIVGTNFVSNGGSSTYEYKVLIDFRVHGRHTVELKFVERNNYEERDLSKKEVEELVMVNCTKRSYTTAAWLLKNENSYGYKQYKNGDAISWGDKSENAYANYGNGWALPVYLKMVCDSL